MEETPNGNIPSTPSSVEATVQTIEPSPDAAGDAAPPSPPKPFDPNFDIGAGFLRAIKDRPYERQSDHPLYRPLKIFALDPSVSRLEGATAEVNVPYEELKPGPEGLIFRVSAEDEKQPVNLDDHNILIANGVDPSTSDLRFHEQMVYAVCSVVYTAFRTALGRHITWGFERKENPLQLLLKPRAFEGNNSHYDKETGELRFGFFRSQAKGEFPGTVYACLSHDTVAHEVTHALLDGLRAHFSLPGSPDVLAFHEGFADLVAVFQHFSYEHVVRAAIKNSRGVISRAGLLTDIARQLGQSGRDYKTALRSAIDFGEPQPTDAEGKPTKKPPKLYDPNLESHELGSVLVIAVFEAFINVFRRKTERLLRLATNGSGRLPRGDLPLDLQAALAEKASKLASQFLTMCIRAIDFCPPVDITFGEYLRAVITADKDLVPDDVWAYREAWIDAFRRHHIFPTRVPDLSEDSLLWPSLKKEHPEIEKETIKGLAFRELRFANDPALPADEEELKRQATVLGEIITRPEWMPVFGLTKSGDFEGDVVKSAKIQSIRSSRRVGPSGQTVFDIVAEVTQKREAQFKDTNETCTFYGGSTIIIDPDGNIRYVIAKSVTDNFRRDQQKRFLDSPVGMKFKANLCGSEKSNLFKMLHEETKLSPEEQPPEVKPT